MKNLVVLTGAGMSAESGISTFRDAGGLWDKYPVEQVATPEGYQRDPALVINFYNERRKQLLEVKPNRGHELLAELEKSFHVTVVTWLSPTSSRSTILISLPTINRILPDMKMKFKVFLPVLN